MNRRTTGPFLILMVVLVLGHAAPHKQWGHGDAFNQETAAWLTAEGDLPFRDFFSHHPPVPFWFAAPAVRLFGPRETTFLGTLLVFYVLALAALFAANRRSAHPFSFGMFVVFLALGHVTYSGHLFLADFFFAFAVLVVFWHFWRLDERHPILWRDWMVVSLAVFVAIGSTLAAAYPLALLAIGLAIKHFRFGRGARGLVRAAGIAGLVALPLAGAVAVLWATGSLRAFWEQVFVFSVSHYRADTGFAAWAPSLAPVGFLLINFGKGLVFLLEAALLRHSALDCVLAWSNLGVIGTLAGARRWLTAAFYLAYVLTLMLRMEVHHGAPYIVHSFWAAAWLLRPAGERAAGAWRAMRQQRPAGTISFVDVGLTAGGAVLFLVLAQAYLEAIVAAPRPATSEEEMARVCAALTSPNDRIAAFPNAPDIYMRSDRKPAVPCFSYLPWLDQHAPLRRAMVESIESERAKLIVINWWQSPRGIVSFRTYADEMRDAIRRHYQPLSISIPRLYARNASLAEVLGRYERIGRQTVLQIRADDPTPLAVFRHAAVTQRFSVSERVAAAKLEVQLSTPRPSAAWIDFDFGVVNEDGDERVLLHDSFRTAKIEYYYAEGKGRWFGVELGEAGDLEPDRTYFFRFASLVEPTRDVLRVWTVAPSNRSDVGKTFYGEIEVPRTVHFRLSGRLPDRRRGNYPIVEQSLARSFVVTDGTTRPASSSAALIRQTLRVPEATTVSAVGLLLDGDGATSPGMSYVIELSDGNAEGPNRDAPSAKTTLRPPGGSRAWRTVSFPPLFVEKDTPFEISVRRRGPDPATTAGLRLWTAGADIYADGELTINGERVDDDLCFRLYRVAPERAGLPDIAVAAFEFAPPSPTAIAPGSTLRLTTRVENRGTSPTGGFWLEFFAQPKDLSGRQTFAVTSAKIANIEPGEAWEKTLERPLYSLADGLYTLTAVADRLGEVAEADEGNNRATADTRDLLVIGRKSEVNLVLHHFAVDRVRYRRGESIQLFGLVSNLGNETAGRFAIHVWAARDRADPRTRFAICDPIVIDALERHQTIDLEEYPRTLYRQMPTGTFYVGCTVDGGNDVAEASESDNTRTVPPQVTITP